MAVIWFALALLCIGEVSSLKICSFNIQSFGERKMERTEVVHVILDIIARCDIMLIMEIKDASGTAFPQLMTRLNSRYTSRRAEYSYIISERLGRKSYKEQYAFIYRSVLKSYKEQYAFIYRQRLVSVKSVYQYPDTQAGDVDAFSREPFVVWFSSPKTEVKDFVIIPIHTTPDAAVREIDELYDVFQDVDQRWTSENYLIIGDFNAACGYVPRREWGNIRLRSNSSFLWLTGDNIDTTVKESTSCAYDRVVLHGEEMTRGVEPTSLEVFDFRREYDLTEQQALLVSDHFPVCITVNATQRRGRGG